MKQQFSSVNEQLQKILKKFNLEQSYAEYEIKEKWSTLVNKQLASVTVPVAIENNVLSIRVTNELWKKEIAARKKELLSMINSSLDSIQIKKIHIL